MAWDAADEFITLPATTGLSQFTFVTVNSAGKIAKPALGARVLGVLVSSGTNGTAANPVGTVQIVGIAKVAAQGSTNLKGKTISASSNGYAKATTGSAYVIGFGVDGSSGTTGRIISVSLTR
jgi:hypothetical protein